MGPEIGKKYKVVDARNAVHAWNVQIGDECLLVSRGGSILNMPGGVFESVKGTWRETSNGKNRVWLHADQVEPLPDDSEPPADDDQVFMRVGEALGFPEITRVTVEIKKLERDLIANAQFLDRYKGETKNFMSTADSLMRMCKDSAGNREMLRDMATMFYGIGVHYKEDREDYSNYAEMSADLIMLTVRSV